MPCRLKHVQLEYCLILIVQHCPSTLVPMLPLLLGGLRAQENLWIDSIHQICPSPITHTSNGLSGEAMPPIPSVLTLLHWLQPPMGDGKTAPCPQSGSSP